jgi:2-dehydro-3-deoxyphosphogluconate aldolase/(4S)-4-hydroxy-2-oxoglutarate aldolase
MPEIGLFGAAAAYREKTFMTLTVEQVMALAPVVPVLVIDQCRRRHPTRASAGNRRPARARSHDADPGRAGGDARDGEVPGAIVGAGTVLNPKMLDQALEAGAQFIVSPGLTESLGQGSDRRQNSAFFPGTATAGDIMRGLDMGLTHFKFFPASTSGGLPALKALAAPLHMARFCPTGGITAESAPRMARPVLRQMCRRELGRAQGAGRSGEDRSAGAASGRALSLSVAAPLEREGFQFLGPPVRAQLEARREEWRRGLFELARCHVEEMPKFPVEVALIEIA